MSHYGFVRVAAATPVLRVADCAFNCERILDQLRLAEEQAVSVVVFPELCITGYTCNDLYQQLTLHRAAIASLDRIAGESESIYSGVAVVSLPLAVDDQLFNCAAVLHGGKVLGVVPKTYRPNYKEFYDSRWFSAGPSAISATVRLFGEDVPFGNDLLFAAADVPELTLAVEICEDLWVPLPPSTLAALAGASVICNPTASNQVIGKAAYRRQLIASQSGRCVAGYIYAASGVHESTTDVVFDGHSLIAENGSILAESKRFCRTDQLTVAEIDLERLKIERLRLTTFAEARTLAAGLALPDRQVNFTLSRSTPTQPPPLTRYVDPHPFVPADDGLLRERCEEIFHTQVAGLAKRLEHIRMPTVSIGISGGLDSTLALLVLCKTADLLDMPRQRIHAFTMPGFGTTSRTLTNARALMDYLGVTAREVDIRAMCLAQMQALGHKPFGLSIADASVETFTAQLSKLPAERRHDLVFENVQARVRTSILMNAGFVIGTGDVSELALGWCTYNADHMSMYNPNVSIPKTLVRFLVRWAALNEFDGGVREVLLDVVATEISPELLPPDEHGRIAQATEASVGPYELNDFFMYYFLRFGFAPSKILYLARHARFDQTYTPEELRQHLRQFLVRFFNNQFKRSCLPDGPKVGTISVSPRGDWRMPSDAQVAVWLAELDSVSL